MNSILIDVYLYPVLISVIISIATGIIGSYVVSRKLVSLTGGVTHASFGGLGIAFFLGISPIIGALVTTILAALLIEIAGKKYNIKEDSSIGIVWSVGMAVGIIFIHLSPGYTPNIMSALFGNILSVGVNDILISAVLDIVLILFFTLFYNNILFISFDRSFLMDIKVPTDFISVALLILSSVTIVICINVVGIVLLISLLSLPAVIAGAFTHNLKKIILLAVSISIVASLLGFLIGYILDVPVSATTVLIMSLVLIVVKILKKVG